MLKIACPERSEGLKKRKKGVNLNKGLENKKRHFLFCKVNMGKHERQQIEEAEKILSTEGYPQLFLLDILFLIIKFIIKNPKYILYMLEIIDLQIENIGSPYHEIAIILENYELRNAILVTKFGQFFVYWN
ncbi:MAG: hypothetical protein QMC93_00795 [Patescibacteria group bacterium]|nr:hypothetical protein [Patescibacteria group bacterium]